MPQELKTLILSFQIGKLSKLLHMKKMSKLFAFFIAMTSFVMIQSCDEDDPKPAAPTLTGPTTIASVQVGTAAEVTFTFDAPGGFASSEIVNATGGTAAIKTDAAADAKSGSVVVEFTAGTTAGAGTITLAVTDKENQTVEQTAAVNISISAPPTLSLSATAASVTPGSTTTVTATITAANGAKNLTVTGATTNPAGPFTLSGATSAVTQDVVVAVPANATVGSTITAIFSAMDNQNLSSTPATLTITVADPTNILTGTVSANTTLNKGVPYLVKDKYIVASGVTLTVQAGAVIKGDKATKGVIIIQPGGKLVAVGTAAEPIVFTSSQNIGERDRGDWGGIVWLGNAYVNQATKPAIEGISPTQNYGTVDAAQADANVGLNTEDNGKLKYVRIEYAGIELTPNNETNSLTMGALGSATEIDYVQTSYGGDDAFEWFGGTVNAKHLVSLSTWDDDFDTDFGWRGNVQWGVVVRNPFFADQSGSTAFESDSQGNANAIGTVCTDANQAGCTRGVFSNITVLGPRDFNNGTGSNSNATRAISANYTRAMHIRRRSSISIYNTFISGFGAATNLQGLQMDDVGTIANFTAGSGVLKNNVLLFPDATVDAQYGSNVAGAATTTVKGFWTSGNTVEQPTGAAPWSPNPGTPANSINPYTAYGITSSLFFGGATAGTYASNPNFAVTTGSLQGLVATDLFPASSKVDVAFFDKTLTYKGAFGGADWTDSWSEFQPSNKVY
jgi:hypothetical protein